MRGGNSQTAYLILRTFISRESVLRSKNTRQADRSTPENVRGSRLKPVPAGFAGNFTRSRTFSADGLKRYSVAPGALFARSADAEMRRASTQENIRMQPDDTDENYSSIGQRRMELQLHSQRGVLN